MVGPAENRASSAPIELGLGLSLAIQDSNDIQSRTQHSNSNALMIQTRINDRNDKTG